MFSPHFFTKIRYSRAASGGQQKLFASPRAKQFETLGIVERTHVAMLLKMLEDNSSGNLCIRPFTINHILVQNMFQPIRGDIPFSPSTTKQTPPNTKDSDGSNIFGGDTMINDFFTFGDKNPSWPEESYGGVPLGLTIFWKS